jgi:hypothetical protein
VREREPQVGGIGLREVGEQGQHLGGTVAIEQQVRIGDEQEVVVRLVRKRLPVVCFGARPVAQPLAAFGEQSVDPCGERGTCRRRSTGKRGEKRYALPGAACVRVQAGSAGSAKKDLPAPHDLRAPARRRRVIALDHVERRKREPGLRILRLAAKRLLEERARRGKLVPELENRRLDDHHADRRVRSRHPRAEHRFGIAGVVGVADFAAEVDVGPGELGRETQVRRVGGELRAQGAHPSDRGIRCRRDLLQRLVVALRDVRRRVVHRARRGPRPPEPARRRFRCPGRGRAVTRGRWPRARWTASRKNR